MSAGMSGDWNAERELWLAFRAIRAEVNRLAGGLEKAVKWMNMAEAKYLEMKREEASWSEGAYLKDGKLVKLAANPHLRGHRADPDHPQSGTRSDASVCDVCLAPSWFPHDSECPNRLAEQSSQ